MYPRPPPFPQYQGGGGVRVAYLCVPDSYGRQHMLWDPPFVPIPDFLYGRTVHAAVFA